jgi:hypothetical protein
MTIRPKRITTLSTFAASIPKLSTIRKFIHLNFSQHPEEKDSIFNGYQYLIVNQKNSSSKGKAGIRNLWFFRGCIGWQLSHLGLPYMRFHFEFRVSLTFADYLWLCNLNLPIAINLTTNFNQSMLLMPDIMKIVFMSPQTPSSVLRLVGNNLIKILVLCENFSVGRFFFLLFCVVFLLSLGTSSDR